MNTQYRLRRRIILAVLIVVTTATGVSYFLLSSTQNNSNKNLKSLPADDNSKIPSNNDLLQAACQQAINDYPQWTKTETALIIWETPDKRFNYRNSPEDPSVGLDSPVKPPGTLADMDFVGLNEICYVNNQNNLWQIGLFKLNGMNMPDNSIIYEESKSYSFIDVSPINKNEYIVLLANGKSGILKYLNIKNTNEHILSTINSVYTDGLKLATSPSGTYVYSLNNKTLNVFDIGSKKQIGKIDSVESVVWLGNSYLLYSDSQKTFIYEIKTKKEQPLDGIVSTTDLSFNPDNGGIIAYTDEGNVQILNCTKNQIINSKPNTQLKTLASEKTAIVENPNLYGFWKFKGSDWTVTFIKKSSIIATTWKRY